MGLVGPGCRHARNCGRLHWRTRCSRCPQIVGILTACLPPMCHCLYRLLAAYRAVLPSKRHRAVGKETGKTSYPIAIQQHVETTGISARAKNLILFQIVGKLHWCRLVLHPSLQYIITCVALPTRQRNLSSKVQVLLELFPAQSADILR